jgi:hypothetical protein
VCCDSLSEILGRGDRAGVVDTRGLVVHGDVGSTCLGKTLLQPIAAGRTSCTVCDHLRDFALGAGVLDGSVVAGSCSVVRLHEAWVNNTIVGGWCAHAAITFLHHDG